MDCMKNQKHIKPLLHLVVIVFLFSGNLFCQIERQYETSLHKTRAGKNYWYCSENGGFELLTKIPISQDCINCHSRENAEGNPIVHSKYSPSCADCHDKKNTKIISDIVCRNCHSHQMAEIRVYKDVHREKGMICIDCHTKSDLHGNGTEPRSIYEGVIEKTCESCHENIQPSRSHTVHGEKLDCSACHMESQITCFNCHFETGKINTGLRDYILLARNKETKKIQVANFMALTFKDRTFYAVGPYKAHTIMKEGRKCNDCHGNATIRKYEKTKKIILTAWDDKKGKINNTKGVIPVPGDWKTAFIIDFIHYDADNKNNNGWSLLKQGADKTQMLFVEPLDAASMKKLSIKR